MFVSVFRSCVEEKVYEGRKVFDGFIIGIGAQWMRCGGVE